MDTTAVSDALDNLLDNAIKYSPKGSRVVIRLKNATAICAWRFRIKASGSTQMICRAFSTGSTGDAAATGTTYTVRALDSPWSKPPLKAIAVAWSDERPWPGCPVLPAFAAGEMMALAFWWWMMSLPSFSR